MAATSTHFKSDVEMVDVERTVTVDALPESIKAEGGLVLDTENLATTEGLKLAKDGHVRSKASFLALAMILTTTAHRRS